MDRPTPQDVITDDGHFFNVCEGMRHGSEAECTVRVFCMAAQKFNRWDMTQEELNTKEVNGDFWWNGTIEAGFFTEVDGVFSPTAKCFGRLMSTGRIILGED